MDFLINRTQHVRSDTHWFSTFTLPQGCVMGPFLYFPSTHWSNTIIITSSQKTKKMIVPTEFSTYRLWYYLMRCHPHGTWWSLAHHSNSWRTHCLSCSPSWFLGQWHQDGSRTSPHDSPARPTLCWYLDILRGMRSAPRSSADQYTLSWVEVCCSWLKWGATEPYI